MDPAGARRGDDATLVAVLAVSTEVEAAARVFYRIVRSNPPTVHDFLSAMARGRVPPDADAEDLRLLAGISVYRTEAQARRKARQYPMLGAYVAELSVPLERSVAIERTTPSPGHHTIWAAAADLLNWVVRVASITQAS